MLCCHFTGAVEQDFTYSPPIPLNDPLLDTKTDLVLTSVFYVNKIWLKDIFLVYDIHLKGEQLKFLPKQVIYLNRILIETIQLCYNFTLYYETLTFSLNEMICFNRILMNISH
jgi:hypothetical protein